VHLEYLNLHPVAVFSFFSAPEVSDQSLILCIINAELSLGVVFELWVVNHFLGDSLSSEQPDTFNLELGLFTEEQVGSKGVLPEMVNSLQESVQHVFGLEHNNSLAFVHLVVNVEDAESLPVVLLEEGFHSLSSSILRVHEESLEVVKIECGGWEHVQGVGLFLLWGFLLVAFMSITVMFFLLRGNLLLLFLLGGEVGLDDLGSEFDVTKSLLGLWEVHDSLNEGSSVGHSFSEPTVEGYLEWVEESEGN